MHFGFTAEQRDLADLAGQVAADLSTVSDAVSAAKTSPTELAVDVGVLVETGLTGLLVPAEQGGFGATVVEAGILAEALGRALVPASVAGSFLIAAVALDLVPESAGRDDLATAIVEGAPVSVAVAADLSWPPTGDGLAWAWRAGATALVPDGTALRPVVVESPGRPTADLTMLVADVGGSEPHADLTASAAGEQFLAMTNCITACLLLGHMRATLERSVAYAKEREQFGARIGSFQAVKHLCADMMVDTEAAHSIAYGAAATLSGGADAAAGTRLAAAAKAWCGDAAVRVCESAIQVHGGIGFTWEVPLHRYLRAAHTQRASFLSPAGALGLMTRLELDRWT